MRAVKERLKLLTILLSKVLILIVNGPPTTEVCIAVAEEKEMMNITGRLLHIVAGDGENGAQTGDDDRRRSGFADPASE